jgi:Putative peptidoglycan binding domain
MAFKAYCGLDGCKPFKGFTAKLSPLGITHAVGSNSRCRNLTDDVLKVQVALNRFTPLEGGPNPKLKEDGIIGSLTSTAIRKFQAKRFEIGAADGIVDVGEKTDRHLANAASTYTSLPVEMMKNVAHALNIISRARNAISHARSYKLGVSTLTHIGQKEWGKLENHFQISKFPNWQHQLQWIDSIYTNMQTAIGYIPRGMAMVLDEPENHNEGAYAMAFAGGYEVSERSKTYYGLSRGSIYLCARMQTVKPQAFAYVLIHELAHFVGPTDDSPQVSIGDFAYKDSVNSKYDQLLPWQRLHNADCYSQFAFDAAGTPFQLKDHFVK